MKPEAHEQLKLPGPLEPGSVQLPPFRQGKEEHAVITTADSHVAPVKPEAQLHVKPVLELLHVPPLRQGLLEQKSEGWVVCAGVDVCERTI